jgi:hypothetical protein
MPLTVTLIGDPAIDQAARVWELLAAIGTHPGFGPEGTTFTPEDDERREEPALIAPPSADMDGVLPEVRIRLTGPLFLLERDTWGHRRPILEPTFADLLRASLRVLTVLLTRYGRTLPSDVAALKEAARRVPLRRANYVPFQHAESTTGRRACVFRGVAGNGVYGPVPQRLLHWLRWGGLVHTGTGRCAGAGGWDIEAASG